MTVERPTSGTTVGRMCGGYQGMGKTCITLVEFQLDMKVAHVVFQMKVSGQLQQQILMFDSALFATGKCSRLTKALDDNAEFYVKGVYGGLGVLTVSVCVAV